MGDDSSGEQGMANVPTGVLDAQTAPSKKKTT